MTDLVVRLERKGRGQSRLEESCEESKRPQRAVVLNPINDTIFEKKAIEQNMCVLILSNFI
jgi:hypothetical protein